MFIGISINDSGADLLYVFLFIFQPASIFLSILSLMTGFCRRLIDAHHGIKTARLCQQLSCQALLPYVDKLDPATLLRDDALARINTLGSSISKIAPPSGDLSYLALP